MPTASNLVVLLGVVLGEPVQRFLADRTLVTSFDLATVVAGSRTAVPVVVEGAGPAADAVAEGRHLAIVGSVRRRFFRVAGATQARTEVVAVDVVAAGQSRAVRRLLDRAVVSLTPCRE